MNQQDLFAELDALRRSLAKLLPMLPPRAEDWRPRENMRSLWELATHLVQIAAVDTLIAREGTQAQVRALEAELASSTPEELLAVFDRGAADARRHFGPMSAADFDGKVTKAFYGHAMPAKGWLLEIVTHSYHHRAMLFTCLKIHGKPVDMSYLYV